MSVFTLGDIAKRYAVDKARVRYIIERDGMEPAARAGQYRLFDDAQVNRIGLELAAIQRKKTGAAAP